jgi:hypothetical protein
MDKPVSRVDKFLANFSPKPRPQQRGNLIFALDATASRDSTWDKACQLQAQMFREVAVIGSLSMQLVYFRGPSKLGGECKASRWVDNPAELTSIMSKIRCDAGYTQIERVLRHACHETTQRKVDAMVFVGDCCEEGRDQLIGPAKELARLGVPVFMFQEGDDHIGQLRFREIAEITHGAYHRFDQGSARQLAELLQAVVAFAVGGVMALEKQGSASARLLLSQVKGNG